MCTNQGTNDIGKPVELLFKFVCEHSECVSIPGYVHLNYCQFFDFGWKPAMKCPCFIGQSHVYLHSISVDWLQDYNAEEDLSKIASEKTGRGPFAKDWQVCT